MLNQITRRIGCITLAATVLWLSQLSALQSPFSILNSQFSMGLPAPAAQAPTKRIGIEAGHGGTDSGALSCDRSVREADVTIAVAHKAAELLRSKGYQVDVFRDGDPAALPKSQMRGYKADAFVALHTDFCPNPSTPSVPTGFKVSRYGGAAGSGLNGSGDASDRLVQTLWEQYGQATGLSRDTASGHYTQKMRYYYALGPGWIDSSTPGAIIEMGWLSGDLDALVNRQDDLAAGVANGILRFLGEVTVPPKGAAASSTTLVMDVSGSMDRPDASGTMRKIDAAINAANMIVDMIAQENVGLGTNHQLALVTFNGQGTLDMPLTPDVSQGKNIIADLYPDDGTNMAQGLSLANDELQKADLASKRIIILLSDGVPTVPLSGEMIETEFTGELYTQLKQEIMAGPVTEATEQGYCIYTVGFGDPTESDTLADGTVIYSIDTEFLQWISAATGCGQYYNAVDAAQLANIYIKLRHESLGQIISQFSGQVAQSETTTAQQIPVPENQGELYATLNWPGSSLDLILTDPNGKTVDENYPGVKMVSYARFVYLIITNPLPGLWQASVYGREVPEGTIDYNAVFSVRAAPEAPLPPAPSDKSALIITMTITMALAVTAFIVLKQPFPLRRTVAPARRAAPFPSGAGVRVMRDYQPGEFVGFRGSVLGIGRDSRNELVLSDDRVSRNHAQIRQEAGGYVIHDQGSTNGTFVNGQQVTSQVLRDGDEIRVGDTRLMFQIIL